MWDYNAAIETMRAMSEVTEPSPDGSQFGVDGLDEALLRPHSLDCPHAVVHTVAQATTEFSGGHQASDDKALVAVSVSPRRGGGVCQRQQASGIGDG